MRPLPLSAASLAIATLALGLATLLPTSPALASGTTTIRVSATSPQKGGKVTIAGTVTPKAAVRHGSAYWAVVRYEVAKTSDTQLGEAMTIPADGSFKVIAPVAAGTHTYIIQFVPMAGWTAVSAKAKITVTG